MTLPVLMLHAGASRAARERTLASIAAQSVQCDVQTSIDALDGSTSGFVVLVLAGTVLDATACERAAWFLASHPTVPCVTGAALVPPSVTPMLASLQQFVVARVDAARELLHGSGSLPAATAIAVALGLRAGSGRGAGWISEPVIRAHADAADLSRVDAEARGALQQLVLDEAGAIDLSASGIPMNPQQRLQAVERPSLQVRQSECRGLRVLVLVQGFPMGGYTAFNAELLPRLVAAGHAVTTCTTEWWRSDWRLEQVRAAAPDVHHAHAVVPSMAVPAYIDWLISSRAIDVVLLSHSYLAFHLLPFLRARHPSVAFVDYVHTDWFEAAMYGSYAEMSATWGAQLDAQLTTSDMLVEHLAARGCDRAGLRAAHIGIDTTLWSHSGERMAAVRASLGAGRDTTVLLFSGRISPEKRPHLAVDVLARLRQEGHDVLLVFAGSGQLLQATHDRAVTLGLADRCKFLGELDEATLRHVYAASDIFIAPSEIEGIARSLYEAMAMGCVPVVSDVGGQRELVVPGTGSLVDAARDAADLYVEGVRPWLDRAARATAGAAARSHVVARFDSQRTVDAVCETLRRARTRRTARQDVLPGAICEELAVLSLEVIRRHMLRVVSR